MSVDQGASVLWYMLALVLVGSALISRRIPLRGVLGMALAWAAIFSGVLLLFKTGERVIGQQSSPVVRASDGRGKGRATEDTPANDPVQTSEGSLMRIAMAPDGHFWIKADVNGISVRFLIDSGATVTALSQDIANRADIAPDEEAAPIRMRTANGEVEARRGLISQLTLGSITMSDVPVVMSDRFEGMNVLGMNTLSRLKSWRVEGREMVLEP